MFVLGGRARKNNDNYVALTGEGFKSEADKVTFKSIYFDFRELAYRTAFGIVKNHDVAEDVVQDAFLAIIRNWSRFIAIPCDKRASYIVIVVRNKAKDVFKLRENQNVSLDALTLDAGSQDVGKQGVYTDLRDTAPTPDAALESKDEAEYIKRCVAQLPEIYKAPLEMRYVLGLSDKEIAKALHIKPHTVTVRIARAKAKLAEIIGEGGQS